MRLIVVASGLVVSSVAFAQPVGSGQPAMIGPPPAGGGMVVEEAPGPLSIGGDLSVIAAGTFKEEANGMSDSADMATALGIGALIDYRVSDLVNVAFAPRVILGVKGDTA